MNAENILPQLEIWESVISRVREQLDALSGVVGECDGPLADSIYALEEAFTDSVAKNIGCSPWPDAREYPTDLHWYRSEIMPWGRPLSVGVNGEQFEVSDLESLAKLIEMTEAS